MLFNGEEQRNIAPPPRNEKKPLEKHCWRGHKTKSKYVGIPNSGRCSSTLAIQRMLTKVLYALCWPVF